MNNLKLNELEGKEVTITASVYSETKGDFKPSIDKKGDITNTTIKYELCMKKGCRVMLTYNLDVCDSLTNGSQGEVIDFTYNKSGKLRFVLVKFDEIESGRERRKMFTFESNYPGQEVTPIEIKESNFPLSKRKTSASATATALQFPLKLAYAATAHKVQGHTVKEPQALIIDLVTWLRPAMAYVMLSRIQTLSQLFIVGSVPEDKIKPWQSALMELERMNSVAINNPDNLDKRFRITSLNTSSLRKHIEDIKRDHQLIGSNVVCLQETWLEKHEEPDNVYQISNFNSHFNSQGRGKGIVTLFSDEFIVETSVADPQFQITKIVSSSIVVINVYRSDKASEIFLKELEKLITFEKTILVCGDFNYCPKNEIQHPVNVFFKQKNFIQLVTEATHREGRLLDHSYLFCVDPFSTTNFEAKTYGCYYSDHNKVVTLVDKYIKL